MSTFFHTPLRRPVPGRQRGVTLIEALVALLVMSFGMLALVGLMSNLRRSADVAKQRSEAMRIARADIADLRTYSKLKKDPATDPLDITDYERIVTPPAPTQITPDDSNTTYTVQRTVTDLLEPKAKLVSVNVSWTDRAGDPQFVNLDTIIAGVDPIFSAVVSRTPTAAPVSRPSGRNPVIPDAAKKLNKDISAFRPSGLGSMVWIFNNVTGVIVGKCTVPAGTPVSSLTAADVDSCKNNTTGYLLSGTVRFSNTSPANPTVPEANAITVHVGIANGTYTAPRLDKDGNVVKDSSGNPVMDTITATAPTYDCFDESPTAFPTTQTFVNYYCIVYPSGTPPTWSGKVVLSGPPLGTTAGEYRVCRYSADYNGDGSIYFLNKIDNNEHPAVYAAVTGSLARQNFLVIRGDLSCPSAPNVDPAAGVFADYKTVQLQP